MGGVRMTAVSFNDNLYGDSPELARFGGCGLKGFVRTALWYYARHDSDCKPGMWLVTLCSPEAGEFWPLLDHKADAVVDDFGNLRRVQ
jgi:hypothetical protein